MNLDFTPRAEARLREIAQYTLDTFGEQQAVAYETLLMERCVSLASGYLPSRSCSALLGRSLATDMRYARAGEHFLIFASDGETLTIIDILHTRSDLPRWIGRLEPGGRG